MIGALSAAAALLLAASGLAKLRAPAPAAGMLVSLFPRARRHRHALGLAVRAGGVAEIAVGGLVLTVGGRLPVALLAAAYVGFTAVAVRLTLGRQPTSCGCFGRADAPVGVAHVVLDVVCVAAAVAAAVVPVGSGGGLFGQGFAVAAIGGMQVILLAGLGYLAITALPALSSARRLEDLT